MSMKVSIVTVSFNSEDTIRDTFESVLSQTYSDLEYIVVDGNSSDETQTIIAGYSKRFENRGIAYKYLSENDKGVFDAMNKGVSLASGDIVGILNSDDILARKDSIAKIVERFESDNCDAVYSDLYIMDYQTMSTPNRVFIAGKRNYKLGWYPPHPTLYLKKRVYEEYGVFNISYKLAADYDFMLRLMKADLKMSYIKEPLIYMRAGGNSTNSFKSYKDSFDEAIVALETNGIRFPYFVNSLRTFVVFKQRILGIAFQFITYFK